MIEEPFAGRTIAPAAKRRRRHRVGRTALTVALAVLTAALLSMAYDWFLGA